ncbi:MAG: response regulator transcription factor [Flavobacteriales bacterium]|nr:response regulator transcription factor [Flavobacteriales bacterium]
MSNEKILLVDDEKDIIEFLGYNLTKEGYDVTTCTNGLEAIAIASKIKPDLIILDVMMPEMDGIETCHEIRETEGLENTLIAFLSARGEDYSQVAGFDAGADDYITKPIKPRLLVSRVKAILRRRYAPEDILISDQVASIKIDGEKYLVYKEGQEYSLPKKEYELLALLLSKPGKVFTRDVILERIWGSEVIVGDRTIDVHIRKLREKFGDDCIKTIKGVGYKFED